MPSEETLLDGLDRLYRSRYHEDILELARDYPRDNTSLYISWQDLYAVVPEFAEEYYDLPAEANTQLVESLQQYDNPVNCSFTADEYPDASVRVCDLGEEQIHDIGELRSSHANRYLGVRGQIAKVTGSASRIQKAVFECLRCGTTNEVPQPFSEFQEPHECTGCDRQGPFDINYRASEFVDHTVMKLQQPPEDAHGGQGEDLTVYLEGDLIDEGGENGIVDRAGERVTIYGTLNFDDSDLRGQNPRPVLGKYLDAEAIEFEESLLEDIDTSAHKEEFTELAARNDTLELLANSVAPELYADDDLEDILLASVLYLFGGYRKSPSDGATYRGDIHMLLIGDPGTSKSTILSNIEELSPRSEFVSGTAVTGVGLTAAATRDDFAGESWSLEPGVLPRANGGHAIIDEIDKATGDAAEKMHDALEGDQQIRVSKAGMRARLATRTGLLASGNPEEGRFGKYEILAEQIDLDPALLSRFDLIFTLQDEADEDRDSEVSDHIIRSWKETGDSEQGRTSSGKSVTERPVSRECIRAWVAYARQHVHPRLPDGPVMDCLREFYLSTRNANDGHEEGNDDAPIPATPRALEAGLRLSEASARARLSDEIEIEDVERAISVTNHSLGDTNFDPQTGTMDNDRKETGNPKSQRDRKHRLSALLEEMEQGTDNGVPEEEFLDAAEGEGVERSRAERDIEGWKDIGAVYSPTDGCLRWVGK